MSEWEYWIYVKWKTDMMIEGTVEKYEENESIWVTLFIT